MSEFRITHLNGTDIVAHADRIREARGLVTLERHADSPGRWRPVLRVPLSALRRLNGQSPRTFFDTTVHTSATWPSPHPGGTK